MRSLRTKKIGPIAITDSENTPSNPPLPDYAEPQKGSPSEEAESGAPAASDETVEE